MKLLRTWMGKEWREQRRVLLILLCLVPLAAWTRHLVLGERAPSMQALVLVPGVLLLHVLGVATHVFASERQRGTLSVLQRLPNGLRAAFLAKLLFLMWSGLLLLLWTLVVVAVAIHVAGPAEDGSRALHELIDPGTMRFYAGFLALASFTALVSMWVPGGGAAAGAAPLLLGVLLLPLAFLYRSRPYCYRLESTAVSVSVVVLLGAVAAAWVSWRHGLRFGSSSWRAFRFGAPVLLLVAAGAYGYEAASLRSYLSLEADDPDLVLHRGWLGTGGRHLFLEAGRNPWYARNHPSTRGDGTPPRPFVVDVPSAQWRPLADFGVTLYPAPWRRTEDMRQVDCLRLHSTTGEDTFVAGTTGLLIPRPASCENGAQAFRMSVYRGWLAFERSGRLILDEQGNEVFRAPQGRSVIPLGTDWVLTHDQVPAGRELSNLTLHDTRTDTARPARNPPIRWTSVCALDDGIALLCDPESRELQSWDPRTGRREPLRWSTQPLAGIDWFDPLGPRNEELLYLCVRSNEPFSRSVVVVDRRDRALRRLEPWITASPGTYSYVGQDDGGGLWLIEEHKRVVRLGPKEGERRILFPASVSK